MDVALYLWTEDAAIDACKALARAAVRFMLEPLPCDWWRVEVDPTAVSMATRALAQGITEDGAIPIAYINQDRYYQLRLCATCGAPDRREVEWGVELVATADGACYCRPHLLPVQPAEEPANEQDDASAAQAAYLASDGSECPHCGHGESVEAGRLDADGGYARGPVECKACGAAWYDEWQLTGFIDLELPEEKDADWRQQALRRVASNSFLMLAEDLLLPDPPGDAAHYRFVATASLNELVDWALGQRRAAAAEENPPCAS